MLAVVGQADQPTWPFQGWSFWIAPWRDGDSNGARRSLGTAKEGGGKRTEEQNLVRMALWKPFWETLRKLFLSGSPEGNSGSLSKGINENIGLWGVHAKHTKRWGSETVFPWRGLLVRFCPPVLSPPPSLAFPKEHRFSR